MRKSVKKFAIAFLAIVLAFATFVGCGGNYTQKALDGDISGEVKSNGGFVVEKGNYVYFINGSEDYTVKNKFGDVTKGSLMRIAKTDLAAGNYAETDVVVPLLFVSQDYNSGIYVYGDYVYYATPTSTKNKDGVVENSYLDFKSSKLDGSSTMRNYYFRVSNNSTAFRFVEVDGVVYCMYVDTVAKEIRSFNTKTEKETVLVKNYESYLFDASDVTNPTVYYTMGVEKKVGYTANGSNQESYKQVYTVKADATECPYEIDLATDYTDDNGNVLDYVNLGTLVFDGIGRNDALTVFNHAGKDGASGDGSTYTLVKYDNDGLYYTKTSITSTGSVGDGGQLYYIAEKDIDATKAVTGNAGNVGNKNVQLAPNTTSASASAIFYIDNGTHYYIYVKDSAIVRAKVNSSNTVTVDETYLTANASGATLMYLDGAYLYYSVAGTSGRTLNRIVYNGADGAYKGMQNDGVKRIVSQKYLDIEFNSSWYKPEIVAGNIFFANASTYGYNYVYTMANPVDDAALKALNEKFETVTDLFTEIAKDYSDASNACKYFFYTADKDTVKTEEYFESYEEKDIAIFDNFVEKKAGEFETGKLVGNVESYFYNMIGERKSSDSDAREDALKSLLVAVED